MPPSKTLPQVISNHITNHQIRNGTDLAIFIFYPGSIDSGLCPIAQAIRNHVNLIRNHHPDFYRSLHPVVVTSWSIYGPFLLTALKSLTAHVQKLARGYTEIIVLIYGHGGNRSIYFDGVPIFIPEIVEACQKIAGLKVLGLLGCGTGDYDLPTLNGFKVFGFRGLVDYADLALFAIGFSNQYHNMRISRFCSNSSFHSAISAAYTVQIPYYKVIKFE